ncbi:MAG: NBR1-Ig-like domain-containing protein [Anaerolineales bacterium]
MKTKNCICTIFFLLFLTSCSGGAVAPTPTPVDIGAVQTAAAETIFANLTQTAAAYTATPELTATPTLTPTLSITETPTSTATPNGTPTETMCDQMVFVSDVTVPDNTEMTAGQEFVKTWKVKNTGSCTWKSNYLIVYGWGDDPKSKMGSQNTAINVEVLPNAEAEISITLKAPSALGTYHGYWRLQNNNGYNFGIPLTVTIVVK